MRGCRSAAVLLLGLCLAAAPVTGRAQAPASPPPQQQPAAPAAEEGGDLSEDLDQVVQGHVKRAQEARARGQHQVAIDELRTAYQMDPQAGFLLEAADAYRQAGQAREALEMYRTFLKKDPAHPQRAEAEAAVRELEQQRAREDKVPVWKKGWFWGIMGGAAVVVIAGVSIGLVFGLRSSDSAIQPGM